jgi:hypothetical protein
MPTAHWAKRASYTHHYHHLRTRTTLRANINAEALSLHFILDGRRLTHCSRLLLRPPSCQPRALLPPRTHATPNRYQALICPLARSLRSRANASLTKFSTRASHWSSITCRPFRKDHHSILHPVSKICKKETGKEPTACTAF